ncbi:MULTISPECIES: DUF421 domain-containing protein [Zymobacter]|uniref:Predicted membrane protein n=1 Tax=Zymobacter palmae TaxID=33074 RepID=A0A348HFU1_9GAMM|nr:YetF domain-containing protein [Zymobacter palmae]BBG30493.1 predicted membrane protein [Zymobacter palmae]
MDHSLWETIVASAWPYVYVAIKLVIGLATFILALRTTSKGQLNQMSPLDLIGNFVMGGILGGVIYSDSITIHHFIIILIIWQTLIITVKKVSQASTSARKVLVGSEIPLVIDGKFQLDRFNELDISISGFATLLRMQGIFSVRDVRYAQMEPNSQLTVIKYDEKRLSALVVKNGEISEDGLAFLKRDEAWLREELHKKGYGDDLESIFFAEWTEELDDEGNTAKGDMMIIDRSETETEQDREREAKAHESEARQQQRQANDQATQQM